MTGDNNLILVYNTSDENSSLIIFGLILFPILDLIYFYGLSFYVFKINYKIHFEICFKNTSTILKVSILHFYKCFKKISFKQIFVILITIFNEKST